MPSFVMRMRIWRRRTQLRRQIQQRIFNSTLKNLRDSSNPFTAVSDTKFRLFYRLPKHLILQLLDDIKPFIQEEIRVTAIPLHIAVLCVIRYLSTGKVNLFTKLLKKVI